MDCIEREFDPAVLGLAQDSRVEQSMNVAVNKTPAELAYDGMLLPHPRLEDWKWTNLRVLIDRPYPPRVKVSDWYRISGPLPLYAHNDDPRLAGWRQQATRAFSRVVVDIVWRAHVAEHSGEDRPERPPSHRAGMTPVGQVSRGRGESILARLRPNAPLRTPARRSCKRDGP